MKKVNLLGKINYIFDRKQKIQLGILGVMIFIGGLLETLGVGAMIPLVNALLMPEKLQEYFPELSAFADDCRFLGCVHIGEKVCGVKAALEAGKLSQSRYENYHLIYQELKEKRRY